MFTYLKGGLPLEIEGKKYFFSHGDDIEIGNYSYKLYKFIVRSRFFNLLADEFLSYSFIKGLGQKISNDSRKRNHKYDSVTFLTKIKTKYRDSVEKFFLKAFEEEGIDFIICGHSHVEEHYKCNQGFYYLNNGFIPKTKKFLHIDNHCPQFVPLL